MSKPRTVLITGGTKGLGLEIALQFAKLGDKVVLTYAWGSVEDGDILAQFRDKNYPLPLLIQADVVNDEDTHALLTTVREKYGHIDIFVSNVSFANLVRTFSDYSEKALLKSIEYSAWPIIGYTQKMKEIMGQYPRYVLGLSSHGPDSYHVNYDFAAITKAVLEVMVKYLNYHFFNLDVRFNIIRTRPIITDSLLSTFGKEWTSFIAQNDFSGTDVSGEDIGKLAVMLTSGLMDGISGETIHADKGYNFADGLQSIYSNTKQEYPHE
jgi:enoyl-[acyl-carrier-protein] reductase (NADH)